MRIVWDEPKRLTTLARRGLDFASLESEFFANAITAPARGGRLRAIGELRGAIIAVFFAPLGSEAISVISMRQASRKERKVHEAKGSASDRRGGG
jgi:uncharacterized DUF497 family protein